MLKFWFLGVSMVFGYKRLIRVMIVFHAKLRWIMVVAHILISMSSFLGSTLDPWSIFLFGVVGSIGHGISISVIYAYCMVGKIYVLDICLNLVIIKFVIRLLHIYIYDCTWCIGMTYILSQGIYLHMMVLRLWIKWWMRIEL